MGADLVGYLVIAPNQISGDMVDAAVAQAVATCDLARTWLRLEQTGNTEALEAFKLPALWEHENLAPDDVADLAAMGEAECRKAVEETIDFLHAPDSRDCALRSIDEDRFALFCGEMSWGEEPEGDGYQILKRMFLLGVDQALGIE